MISIIAAIAQNNCIGKDGTLPWHLPEDMKHFRAMTKGKSVIMGRNTWESLPDAFRPLPERTNIVITRTSTYPVPDGVLVYHTLTDAIASQTEASEIIIIGGAQVYAAAMDMADRLYITHVPMKVDGDTFFPTIDSKVWKVIHSRTEHSLTFTTYARIS